MSNVHFNDSIRNALHALDMANLQALALIRDEAPDPILRAYRDGWHDALQAVAMSLGIELPAGVIVHVIRRDGRD